MLTQEAQKKCQEAGIDPATIMAIIQGLIALGPEVIALVQKIISLIKPQPAPTT